MSDDIIRFRLTGTTLAQLRVFAAETGADLGCRAVAKRDANGFSLDAYLIEDLYIEVLQQNRDGISIEFIENFTQTSRSRRSEVSYGNRYSNPSSIPRGLGIKE